MTRHATARTAARVEHRRRNAPEVRTERVTIWLAFDTATALRLEAARTRYTLSRVVERALNKHLAQPSA